MTARRLEATSPIEPAASGKLPLPQQKQAADAQKGLDLLRAAGSRVASLEAALKERDSQLAAAQADLEAAKVGKDQEHEHNEL